MSVSQSGEDKFISPQTYFFYESFSYKAPENDKTTYTVKEVAKLIPVVSFFVELDDLKEILEKRKLYNLNPKKYVYDYRLSNTYLISKIITSLGLGLLILPARLLATSLKEKDQAEGKKCLNPHLLTDAQWNSCLNATINKDKYYETLLEKFPDKKDLAARLALRDHVQNPEYLYKSLFKDPLAQDDDIEFINKLPKENFDFSTQKAKINIMIWGDNQKCRQFNQA